MQESSKNLSNITTLYNAGEYKKVIDFIDPIKNEYSKNKQILNILGASLINEKLYDRAIDIFLKIKNISPNEPFINLNIGNLYRLNGNLDLAIEFFEKEIDLAPNNFHPYFNISLALISQNKLPEAIINLKNALDRISTQDHSLINEIGDKYISSLINIGKLEEAMDESKKLLLKFPDSSSITWKLGNLYRRKESNHEAIECYKKALLLDDNNKAIKFDLAIALKAVGKLEESTLILKDLNFKNSQGYYIVNLFHLGQKEKLLEAIDTASKNHQGNRIIANLNYYASHRYNYEDKYPFCNEPFEFIYTDNFIDVDFTKNLLDEIETLELEFTKQGLLEAGKQSSGNLFKIDNPIIEELKVMLLDKIEEYKKEYKQKDQYFIKNWPDHSVLNAWYIDLKKGGSLDYHYHHEGWLSGSMYLKMPKTRNKDEGSIEFGYNNIHYEVIDRLPTKKIKPKIGDIVLFPSSLSHRVIPFDSKDDNENRISLAFDLIPEEF